MSSHYFVKEHQEYSLIILGIPKNEFWKGILAWQPFVMVNKDILEEAQIYKIDPDSIFSLGGDRENNSDVNIHFPDLRSFLEEIFKTHPNNSFFFLINDPTELKELIVEFDIEGKSIELMGDNSREMLVQTKLKKFIPQKLGFRFQGEVIPDPDLVEHEGWSLVSKEGLYEFRSSKPTWLSIRV